FILRPFFLQCYATPPYLYSFPTRRSSDLIVIIAMENTPYSAVFGSGTPSTCPTSSAPFLCSMLPVSSTVPSMNNYGATSADGNRSEEHTSELQSRFDLVCRLLLEKKKHVHDELAISVADEGMGIPAEEGRKIIVKFYRVGRRGIQGRRGMGVDLALAMHVADAHVG